LAGDQRLAVGASAVFDDLNGMWRCTIVEPFLANLMR
jgi:hypothetical protein